MQDAKPCRDVVRCHLVDGGEKVLVSKREGLCFPKIEFFGIIMHNLRLSCAGGLRACPCNAVERHEALA